MCIVGGYGALAEESPNADQAISEALAAETTIGPSLQDGRFSLAILDAHKARLPDRFMLGSYVKPMEWGSPLVDTPDLGLDKAQLIIDR